METTGLPMDPYPPLTPALDLPARRLLHHLARLTNCDPNYLAGYLLTKALETEQAILAEILHTPEETAAAAGLGQQDLSALGQIDFAALQSTAEENRASDSRPAAGPPATESTPNTGPAVNELTTTGHTLARLP